MDKLTVKGTNISVDTDEYISLTDIAKHKDSSRTDYLISNWLRNRNTIEFLGIWEQIHNEKFNPIEFDGFRKNAGLNSFVLTVKQWTEKTNAIGIFSKAGRYGGTFAHKDIAFEFAAWISVEFKLYLINEFQRLKKQEEKQVGWNVRRTLAKINYSIHTDAIQQHLIPKELSKEEINNIYASEADVLNMALFSQTAKQWREQHPQKEGNMRDYANISQLVCLSNLENLNAHFIKENIPQSQRLQKLNQIAISQMKLLTKHHSKELENPTYKTNK